MMLKLFICVTYMLVILDVTNSASIRSHSDEANERNGSLGGNLVGRPKKESVQDIFRFVMLRSMERFTDKVEALDAKIPNINQQLEILNNSTQARLETKIEALGKSLLDQLILLSTKVNENQAKLEKSVNDLKAAVVDKRYDPGRYVFLVTSKRGVYKMSKAEAEAACVAHGAVLASLKQLQNAARLGMTMCRCGWLSDGKARYPMQWSLRGCGSLANTPGIPDCGTPSTSDGYCFRGGYTGPVYVIV
eukprot:GHVU01161931.1.p1 GENE.GHVU01161931.1~~GHVU01161931.1.p1  ORF type:complete len:248 (-),score=17.90 GHVU01161931.1:234-977(-)